MSHLLAEIESRLERLADDYATTRGAPTPEALRGVYAAECLRLMRWGAHQQRWANPEDKPFDWPGYGDMTPEPPLPPDDWPPTEETP